MSVSRRDLSALLPLLFGASAASTVSAEAAEQKLPSTTLRYEDLKVKTSGENRSRQYLSGLTHTGFAIDLHETELPPGGRPHASHHHEHEEMIFIREGEMEVTIEGKKSRLGPGGVAYVASNEEHGWQNVGSTTSKYFVLALGRQG